LIITFVKLNLFIAVVLDAFGQAEEDDATLSEDDFSVFIRAWRKLDPEKTLSIRASKIKLFVGDILEGPLGLKGVEFDSLAERNAEIEKIVEFIPIRWSAGKQATAVVGMSDLKLKAVEASGPAPTSFKIGATVQMRRGDHWVLGVVREVLTDGQYVVSFSEKLEPSPSKELTIGFHDVSMGLAQYAWTSKLMATEPATSTLGEKDATERAKSLRDIRSKTSEYDDHHGFTGQQPEFDARSYLAAKTLIRNWKVSKLRKAVAKVINKSEEPEPPAEQATAE
jgi:hypothetical protein